MSSQDLPVPVEGSSTTMPDISTFPLDAPPPSLWQRLSLWASENKAMAYTVAGAAFVATGAGAVCHMTDSRRTAVEEDKQKGSNHINTVSKGRGWRNLFVGQLDTTARKMEPVYPYPVPDPTTLAPAPNKAPNCIICKRPTVLRETSASNQNGNAGRPYYKCMECDKFHCFADQRGNDPINPPCYCGESSKRQRAGSEASMSRQVHYVCRLGACRFFRGGGVTIDDDLLEPMARHYII